MSTSTQAQANPDVARTDWIQACRFHDANCEAVLREVKDRVTRVPSPVVLLDLDSTLYEVQPRTHQILKEWIEAPESAPFPHVRDTVRRMEASHLGYSMKDTFAALGFSLDESEIRSAWESAKKFWSTRFFSSAYLSYDVPYPGAPKFCQGLEKSGATLVYLTGRSEPEMGEGTRSNLVRDGFPWGGNNTQLFMKPKFEYSDLNHKKESARRIQNMGVLVASFENEPANLVALHEIFPDAMHVFVETISSDHPASPRAGLYRIRSFPV